METYGKDMSFCYRIVLESDLDPSWSEWFDGFAITPLGDGTTLLDGKVKDQAGLHGILLKLRNFGLSIVSLQRKEG